MLNPTATYQWLAFSPMSNTRMKHWCFFLWIDRCRDLHQRDPNTGYPKMNPFSESRKGSIRISASNYSSSPTLKNLENTICIYIYTCNVNIAGTYTPVGFKLDLLCTRFWYCKISDNLSQQSVPTGESSHANDLPQPGHCGQTVTSWNLRQGQIIETNMCVYISIL